MHDKALKVIFWAVAIGLGLWIGLTCARLQGWEGGL